MNFPRLTLRAARFQALAAAMLALWAVSVRAQAPAVATNVKTLLWEVSGPGLKAPSYLYGTMHVKQRAAYQFDKVLLEKLDGCEAFAGELDMSSANMAGAQAKMLLPDTLKIAHLVSKEDFEMLDALMKREMSMGMVMLNKMKPMFVLTLLQQKELLKAGDTPDFLDQYLYNRAKGKSKKMLALETVDEQMEALAGMAPEKQAEMLVKAAREYDEKKQEADAQREAMVAAYVEGDLQALTKIFDEEDDLPAEMKTALVETRNRRMADRMAAFAAEQSIFVAVGAMHLPGKVGVIQLLRDKGLTVKPVPCPFNGSAWADLQREFKTYQK